MSINAVIIDPGTGQALHSVPSIVDPSQGPILITETQAGSHGVWQSVSVTGASTTIIAQPIPGGAIVITDIVVSSKKKAASTILIQFTDGSNTEVLMAPDIISDTANIVWSPKGLILGWKNARIEVVTDATFDATVTVGYVKLINSLTFSAWDGLR